MLYAVSSALFPKKHLYNNMDRTYVHYMNYTYYETCFINHIKVAKFIKSHRGYQKRHIGNWQKTEKRTNQ